MSKHPKIQKSVGPGPQCGPGLDGSGNAVVCELGIVNFSDPAKSCAEKELPVCWNQPLQKAGGITVEPLQCHERTDWDIAEAASRGLQLHVQVPDAQIRVRVEKGIVTLVGEVEHKYEEMAAKNAVRDLMGVQGVVSLIRVKQAVSSLQLKKNIQSALRRAELDARRIKVDVRDHEVTLRGTVSTREDRADAERAARDVAGVLNVKDNLTVAGGR